MKKLDNKDKKILQGLFKNGRAPITTLAKYANVSKEVAGYRLKKMQDQKIISKVIPIIDFSAIGYTTFRLMIRLAPATEQEKESFLQYAHSIKQINWMIQITGRWDLALAFNTQNNSEFYELYDNLMLTHSKIIQDMQFSIIRSITYLSPNYITGEEDTIIKTNNTIKDKKQHIKHDLILEPIQKKILILLMKDGRSTLLKLSKSLDVSVNTIKYHINILKKNKIILGFKPILNVDNLGYHHYKVVLQLSDFINKEHVKTMLKEEPHVVYITEPLGKNSLEFEAEHNNINGLLDFIAKIREGCELKDYEIFFNNKEILINEVPR